MDFSSPARLLAPAALILALVAVGAIVASTTGGGEETPPAAETSQEGEGRTTARTTPARTQTAPRT